ncbi:hypothetical protein [Streptomyces sp. NPDC019890]|uniref:hypothetical protein n=1 Tax=Streptomyces sp. NPDC019890 TaxID=3365064 RepID=UPI00384D3366
MSADGTTPLSGSRAVKTWTDALGRTSLVQHFTATDLTTKTDTSYTYDPRGDSTSGRAQAAAYRSSSSSPLLGCSTA